MTFAFDLNGIRTSKTVSGVTHNYLYASGKLLRETYGSNTLYFFYDNAGYPYALKYNGTTYYYVTNLQDDVIGMVNSSGTSVASYTYDPYGKVLTATGTMAEINPLRYRGYYYDTETGFYYLQSRYYDPAIGRFINADSYASTGQNFIGYNMFAYCGNNPVITSDPSGYMSIKEVLFKGIEKLHELSEEIKNALANQDGTYSKGFAINLSPGIWNFSLQIGISVDTKGNTAIQGSFSGGATMNSSPIASAGSYVTNTNAPTVNELNGMGYLLGGSGNIPIPPVAISAGVELNIIPDTQNNTHYYGTTLFAGVAPPIPGGELHAEWGSTETFVQFNIFDIIDWLYTATQNRG